MLIVNNNRVTGKADMGFVIRKPKENVNFICN